MAGRGAELKIWGVRHHGPGCARALRQALDAFDPEVLLIEGPPEASALAALAPEARPPVALVVYDPESPGEAVFHPFEDYSPELQALRWAAERGRPARFMDLPLAARRSLTPEAAEAPREDPFSQLARAAGFEDHDAWWEHRIEQREDVGDLFDGIDLAMQALRGDALTPTSRREALREAWMRREIRRASRRAARVGVVCGAWHAPALAHPFPAAHDEALLKGLPKKRMAATWVPWSSARMAARSGYGAGLVAPGWSHHLWEHPRGGAARWVARCAGVLRASGRDPGADQVISAVRLAEALAALRGLPAPGRHELADAMRATLCAGDDALMDLIARRVEVGERVGEAPPGAPTVPLQRDVEARRKRLRLRFDARPAELDLDLREPRDREKSALLHQLDAIGLPWGALRPGGGRERGAAREAWVLRWDPAFDLRLIEANALGNTLPEAAEAALREAARDEAELPALTRLLERAALCGLEGAALHVLEALRDGAARAGDLRPLAEALVPLVRVRRYGDVRATPARALDPVIDGLAERVTIGLVGACAALDAPTAEAMGLTLGELDEALALLQRPGLLASWRQALRRLAEAEGHTPLLRGRALRLLLDAGALPEGDLDRLARHALSRATPSHEAAAWLSGAVRGSGLTLLHQGALMACLDQWLAELDGDTFVAQLPLLRRAFADLAPAERRHLGQRLRGARAPGPGEAPTAPLDAARAALTLPLLTLILEGTHVRAR